MRVNICWFQWNGTWRIGRKLCLLLILEIGVRWWITIVAWLLLLISSTILVEGLRLRHRWLLRREISTRCIRGTSYASHHCRFEAMLNGRVSWDHTRKEAQHIGKGRLLSRILRACPIREVCHLDRILLSEVRLWLEHLHWNIHVEEDSRGMKWKPLRNDDLERELMRLLIHCSLHWTLDD